MYLQRTKIAPCSKTNLASNDPRSLDWFPSQHWLAKGERYHAQTLLGGHIIEGRHYNSSLEDSEIKEASSKASLLTWLQNTSRLLLSSMFLYIPICCCLPALALLLSDLFTHSQYSPYCVAECPCTSCSTRFLTQLACATPTANALVGSCITVNELNPWALVLVDN
mmetsp:Transcript_8920/g.12927  ORF Transcript_8920/g.12927 Transcript_8920/m.12927 type:complete len:166 (+) Transcript_8920:3996-4493(+)